MSHLDLYRGKNVLVTGHTGFKGGWLSMWLNELGANVIGASLEPEDRSVYPLIAPFVERDLRVDVRNRDAVLELVASSDPDFVFHLAAQPLVLRSFDDPIETVETNVMGTVNLLNALRLAGRPTHCVIVTSDKCYRNREWEFAYRENDPLGGKDVYSGSKAAAEIITASMAQSFFSKNGLGNVATARGGNVIGGGDFAANRILPDCIRALKDSKVIEVRNPRAIRPWQHVLDCLHGYLTLGCWLAEGPPDEMETHSFNFGPPIDSRYSVRHLVEEVLKHWPGNWTDISGGSNENCEAKNLSVSTERASALLNWRPRLSFGEAVESTVEWYKAYWRSDSRDEISAKMREQIRAYSTERPKQN